MKKNSVHAVAPLFAAISAFSGVSVRAADFLEPIRPDTVAYYSTCPPCEASFQSITGTGNSALAEKAVGVVENYLASLGNGDPGAATGMFCPEGALSWQGQSEMIRNDTTSIGNYQQYMATWLDGKAPTLNCVQAIELSPGLVRVQGFVDYTDTPACERATWTVDLQNSCIAAAYGSSVANDPEELRQVDFDNKMPWQDGDEVVMDAAEALIPSDKGSCAACEAYGDESLTDQQIARATGQAFSAWVSALLENNSTAITDEYCENATLWGTVSAVRRNTYDEIKSYFDWFANSRNFTEAIDSVCPKVTKLGEGMFLVSESLRLDGQCLKMQFTVSDRGDGNQCVASLDSSYTPETPKLLAALDAGPMPSPPGPQPSSGSVPLLHASLVALAFVAFVL
jgi:hypothetical protein